MSRALFLLALALLAAATLGQAWRYGHKVQTMDGLMITLVGLGWLFLILGWVTS